MPVSEMSGGSGGLRPRGRGRGRILPQRSEGRELLPFEAVGSDGGGRTDAERTAALRRRAMGRGEALGNAFDAFRTREDVGPNESADWPGGVRGAGLGGDKGYGKGRGKGAAGRGGGSRGGKGRDRVADGEEAGGEEGEYRADSGRGKGRSKGLGKGGKAGGSGLYAGKGGGRGGGKGGRGGPPAALFRGAGRGTWGVQTGEGTEAGGTPLRSSGPRRKATDALDDLGEDVDGSDDGFDSWDVLADEINSAAGDDQPVEAFGGLTMRELQSQIMDAQMIFPMREPKPKGLARLLRPDLVDAPPQYDHTYPFGLQPFDLDPPNTDLFPGRHRESFVDRLLSHQQEEGEMVHPLHGSTEPGKDPLSTVDGWFDALQLPPGARMRRNPRFVRILEEFSIPSKYTAEQREEMLYSLKFGLACDPVRAGYEGGVLPFEVPGFDPSEMDPYITKARGKPKGS